MSSTKSFDLLGLHCNKIDLRAVLAGKLRPHPVPKGQPIDGGCFLPTLKAGFFSAAQTGLETALLAGRPHRGMGCRYRLRMSIAARSSGDDWKTFRLHSPRHESVLNSLFPTRANTEKTGSRRNGFVILRTALYDAVLVVFIGEIAGFLPLRKSRS